MADCLKEESVLFNLLGMRSAQITVSVFLYVQLMHSKLFTFLQIQPESETKYRAINVLSRLVLSRPGSETQTSRLQKQSARPRLCPPDETIVKSRHLHLPETWRCVRSVGGGRSEVQTESRR